MPPFSLFWFAAGAMSALLFLAGCVVIVGAHLRGWEYPDAE